MDVVGCGAAAANAGCLQGPPFDNYLAAMAIAAVTAHGGPALAATGSELTPALQPTAVYGNQVACVLVVARRLVAESVADFPGLGWLRVTERVYSIIS